MHLSATWLRYPLLLALLACLLAGAPGDRHDSPLGDGADGAVGDVAFRDAAGRRFALRDLKGRKAVVVVFLSFECPVSTGYAPALAELSAAYRDRGVAFVGVSEGDESAKRVEQLAHEFGLPFPVFRDERGAAEALRAKITPEAVLLDGDLIPRYRGRIDERYAARLKPNARVGRQDLREALDELLAGRSVSEPETQAIGCAIPRRQSAPPGAGAVTYHRDVLPILQAHCQECHRPGEVAPFALTTYRQAVNWADDLKEYTQSRKMPPWKAVDGLPMHGERRMTDGEIATLAAWVDGGMVEGDPATAPPPRRFPDGWRLGEPDLVLTMGDDFTLGASGTDLYRCFVLPTHLADDHDVIAVEVRPGNRRVVHHAVLFVDTTGRARQLEADNRGKNQGKDDDGPGYSVPMAASFLPGFLPDGGMGGWTPGTTIRPLSDGAACRLPRGADVVMQLHYHRDGRTEKDRTSVGLYFATGAPRRPVQGMSVPAQFLYIPAGADRYRVSGSVTLREDCRLHAISPHMHLLGREIKVTMTPPGGQPRTLVAVKDWDFNWQDVYFFKEAVEASAGTRFDVEAIYDNSAANPNNPNSPPKTVMFGLQSTDEMCVAVLAVTSEKPGRIHYELQPRIPGLNWAPLKLTLPGI
jgi:peroxiredoxin/mono/diheme cytochrome c family protein